MRSGYFWLTVEEDAREIVRHCSKCQLHANTHHLPMIEFHSMSNRIPFYQWGMDLVGHFPKAVGGKEFLIVAIDHFTKWVEAKQLASITARKVKDFFYDTIITRFRIPKILITDNGSQFKAQEFHEFCKELHIKY